MNSNNLELSLIENEIEKISSRYHLKQNNPPNQLQTANQMTNNYQNFNDKQGQITNQTQKSSSVLSFGTAMNNNNAQLNYLNNGMIKQNFIGEGQINPLQELTLNKQGEFPQPKDQKLQLPKINPKDLSNEELEYIIKTGKMPPRLANQEQKAIVNPATLQQSAIQNPISSYNQQSLLSSQINGGNLNKTSNQLLQLQSYLGTNNQDKENFIIKSVQNFEESVSQSLKNYNSPRIISDYKQTQINQQQQVQPINLAQNSFIQLENSAFVKTFDLSQSQQQNPFSQSTSQAASSALKALQEKIKALENQNALLENKLQIVESQSKETIQRLQTKLKEETDKGIAREQHLKEELQIMKRQLETVESEKLRHLEESSSEREQWRIQYKKVEEENLLLKQQLQEHIEKYDGIEETIKDIKRREQQLRDRYEKELEAERERSKQLDCEAEDARKRYEEMKKKIREQNKEIEKENIDIKEEMDKVVSEKDRTINMMKREVDKWKRECSMLKEEMSILGNEKNRDKDLKCASTQGLTNGITPKSMNLRSARNNCKSPQKDQKQNTQQIVINQISESHQHSHSIDDKRKKSQSTTKHSKKRNTSNVPSISQDQKISQNTTSNRKARGNHSIERKSSLSASKIKKNNKVQRKQSSTKKQKNIEKQQNSQSQSNLISINTKEGNTVVDYELNSLSNKKKESSSAQNYIFIENNPSLQQSSIQKPNSFNQYKRGSIESVGTIQFGLSSTISDYGALLLSQQFNSADQQLEQQQQQQSKLSSYPRPGLDLNDITKHSNINNVDNEIFYLEREIFDYNQQYKTLLSQQTTSSMINGESENVQSLNQKLRQVAQLLEEKSERLFDLKKQQQQQLLRESYRDQGVKGLQKQNQIKQNY